MIVTLAPSAVIATTIALPMPESPPVTRTCFPSKRPCFNISVIAAELLSKLAAGGYCELVIEIRQQNRPLAPKRTCVNLIALPVNTKSLYPSMPIFGVFKFSSGFEDAWALSGVAISASASRFRMLYASRRALEYEDFPALDLRSAGRPP